MCGYEPTHHRTKQRQNVFATKHIAEMPLHYGRNAHIIAETDNYPSLRYNHIINTPNDGKIFLYYGWNVHHQRTKQQQNGGYIW